MRHVRDPHSYWFDYVNPAVKFGASGLWPKTTVSTQVLLDWLHYADNRQCWPSAVRAPKLYKDVSHWSTRIAKSAIATKPSMKR